MSKMTDSQKLDAIFERVHEVDSKVESAEGHAREHTIKFGEVPDLLRQIIARLGNVETRIGNVESDVKAIRDHFCIDDEMANLAKVRAARYTGIGGGPTGPNFRHSKSD